MVAPLVSFDSEGNLQFFREAIYITYAIVGWYKDRPFKGLKDLIVKKSPDVSYVYERMGTRTGAPPEWLTCEGA